MKFTSYERVKAALEHREADRIPFDLGGSVLTGMNKHCYIRLRKYLGLPEKEVVICDTMQQLTRIDDDMVERLNIDVRCVDPSPPSKSGLVKAVSLDGDYYSLTDEWGIEWKMPKENGHYFDMTKRPLENAESPEDILNYPWPDPVDVARFATLKERADNYVYKDKKAYILGRQYAGIWETALWMCGFEKFFVT